MIRRGIALAHSAPMALNGSPGKSGKLRLLAVDDDRGIHLTLQMILQEEFHLSCVSTAQAAMEFLYREPVDALILDISMPEVTGIELLKIIRQRHPNLPVVMLTGNTDLRSIVGAMKAGRVRLRRQRERGSGGRAEIPSPSGDRKAGTSGRESATRKETRRTDAPL